MIVMTLLVRDEADIVAATIEHHVAAGVDLIIATDNNSVDGTEAVLAAYQAAGVLELHRQTDRAFRQAQWVTAMARRAAIAFGAHWVINSDADEFLWPPDALREVLGTLQAAAIVVERDNLIEDPEAEGPWPSRLTLRDQLSLNAAGKRIAPKTIHKGDPEVLVGYGNHTASGPLLNRPSGGHPFRILHAPDRGLDQYQRKIHNGATAVALAGLDPQICAHWREENTVLENGNFPHTYHSRKLSPAQVNDRLATGELVRDTRLCDRLQALMPAAVLPGELDKVINNPK